MRPFVAVRAIVSRPDGQVLILRRRPGNSAGDRWCLPGGKVEYGETLSAAVARELQEETSLRCASSRCLFIQDSLPLQPGGDHYLNVYFECEALGDPHLSEEAAGFAWISPAELAGYSLTFRNDEGLSRYWAEQADPSAVT